MFVPSPQPKKGLSVLAPKDHEGGEVVESKEGSVVYTLEDHTIRKTKEIVDLFERLRERILGLAEEGEIIEKANKMYIGYSHGKNFCEIRLQTRALQIWLDIPSADLDDPYRIVRDVSKIGHYGTGSSEIRLAEASNLERVMSLVEQSFRQTM